MLLASVLLCASLKNIVEACLPYAAAAQCSGVSDWDHLW